MVFSPEKLLHHKSDQTPTCKLKTLATDKNTDKSVNCLHFFGKSHENELYYK